MIRKFTASTTATILTILLPLVLAGGPDAIAAEPESDSMNPERMDKQTAERFARLALVALQPDNYGFSWSVSVQGKARLAVNGHHPLQEPERCHGR